MVSSKIERQTETSLNNYNTDGSHLWYKPFVGCPSHEGFFRLCCKLDVELGIV